MKATWSGFATEVEAKDDGDEDGQRAVLAISLTGEMTPMGHVGRKVEVVLTKPMLEAICQVAMDTRAVYSVEIGDPSDELWRDAFTRRSRVIPGFS